MFYTLTLPFLSFAISLAIILISSLPIYFYLFFIFQLLFCQSLLASLTIFHLCLGEQLLTSVPYLYFYLLSSFPLFLFSSVLTLMLVLVLVLSLHFISLHSFSYLQLLNFIFWHSIYYYLCNLYSLFCTRQNFYHAYSCFPLSAAFPL